MSKAMTLAELKALNPCNLSERAALFDGDNATDIRTAFARGATVADICWLMGGLGMRAQIVAFANFCATYAADAAARATYAADAAAADAAADAAAAYAAADADAADAAYAARAAARAARAARAAAYAARAARAAAYAAAYAAFL